MTRITFYILQQSDTDEVRLDFSCRLIEKAVKQGNRVAVRAATEEAAGAFDSLLWSYKPESYVPHRLTTEIENTSEQAPKAQPNQGALEQDVPVVISHAALPSTHRDVIVNLSAKLPNDFASYHRFAQIVNQSPELLAASRQHFAFFKERGYPIEINKLNR